MVELFMVPLGVLSTLIAAPTVGYLLIGLSDGFPELRLRQGVGIVAVAAWLFTKARWPETKAGEGRPVASSPWDLDDEELVGAGKPSPTRAGVG